MRIVERRIPKRRILPSGPSDSAKQYADDGSVRVVGYKYSSIRLMEMDASSLEMCSAAGVFDDCS